MRLLRHADLQISAAMGQTVTDAVLSKVPSCLDVFAFESAGEARLWVTLMEIIVQVSGVLFAMCKMVIQEGPCNQEPPVPSTFLITLRCVFF